MSTSRTRLTALPLLLVLAALAGSVTASANRMEFAVEGSGEEITGQSLAATFTTSEFGGARISCKGTFSGRYERIISKTSGSHIGNITFAGASECTWEGTAASVTFLPQRSPWEERYRSFTGTLPSITNVLANIAQLEFLIRAQIGLQIIQCLYRAEAEALVIIEPRGIAYLAEAGARLVTTLSGICPVTIRLGGSYPFVASSLRYRLI
jgi:hypothetical protein